MAKPRIDYADVQGTVLRGYRVDLARHFVLSVTDVAGARAFIVHLVDGTDGLPRITTAARWTKSRSASSTSVHLCRAGSVGADRV